ncbi:hypothetical protein TUM3794_18030 [Shewanella colwelliana]|uniref:histidine kinase n=1 Tax=Shewanella colwelliana TaxID=23 RepID=A0ABQ4NZ79_SHECO|nr:two-component regulator propeller domain-containing protein [Shewanella colwelliana]GIU40347.1 hypothetical protein TUM3794_18030 [Shewanella colwelliana]
MRVLIFSLCYLVSCYCIAYTYQPQFDSYGAKDGLSMNTINDVVSDNRGNLWIATQAGLNRFDGIHFTIFDTTNDQYGPSVKHIKKLHFGKQLWLIMRNDGLNLYHPQTEIFESFNSKNSPLPDDIIDIHQDDQANLWVATKHNGLIYFSPSTRTILRHLTKNSHAVLPSEKINVLFNDKYNRLWLGTESGLASIELKHDKLHITPWGKGLQQISAIEQGSSNTLWVATEQQGLYLLDIDNESLTAIETEASLKNKAISTLKRDKFGTLWIGFRAHGLARFSFSNRRLHRFNSASENRYSINSPVITALWIDDEQQLWIGSQGGGLSKTFLDAQYFGHIHGFSFNNKNLGNMDVRAIVHDKKNNLWVGTATGVYIAPEYLLGSDSGFELFDPLNSRLAQSFISFIQIDQQGQIWIGTRGDGLFIYASNRKSYIHYLADSSDNSLPSNYLYSLFFDNQQTPWVTTKDNGIARYINVQQGFKTINKTTTPTQLPTNAITAMTQDEQDNYWLTSFTDGLIKMTSSGEITHFNLDSPTPLPKEHLFSVVTGTNNQLWIASNEGLLRFDVSTNSSQLFTDKDGLVDNTIYLLFADHAQQLWIGTTKGMTHLNPDTLETTNYTDIDGLQDNEFNFNAATLGPNNTIYLGGINGFNHFNPSQLPKRQPPGKPIINEVRVLNQHKLLPNDTNDSSHFSLQLSHEEDIFSLHYHSPNLHKAKRLIYEYRMIGLNDTWLRSSEEQKTYFTGLPPGQYIFQVRAIDINQNSSAIAQLAVSITPAPWRSSWAYALYFSLALIIISFLFYRKWWQYQRQSKLLKEIAQSEQRLQLALWGSGDEFWDWDITSSVATRANVFLKYPDKETELTQTMIASVHPEDLPTVSAVANSCINDKQDKFSITYRALDLHGDWIWVLNRGQIVERDSRGQGIRIAGTIKNIQQQKETEHQLRELNQDLETRVIARTQELQQRNDELKHTLDELKHTQGELLDKEKMAALGGLVASITHEVNTPIGISVTATSHLQESVNIFNQRYAQGEVSHEDFEQYQNEVAECCKLMLSNLERASRLIASFKKVSVDQSHEDIREFDLNAYLEEIFISLNPMLSRTPHTYQYQCPEQLIIRSTPGAFYQIISNLFNNSVAHAYPDERSGLLSLVVERDDDGITMTYKDDGCGMDESVQSQVFQPFFTTKRGKGGSGLGMNIVFNIVTQVLSGSIRIESTPGQGSTFIIKLPNNLLVEN